MHYQKSIFHLINRSIVSILQTLVQTVSTRKSCDLQEYETLSIYVCGPLLVLVLALASIQALFVSGVLACEDSSKDCTAVHWDESGSWQAFAKRLIQGFAPGDHRALRLSTKSHPNPIHEAFPQWVSGAGLAIHAELLSVAVGLQR